MEGASPEDVQKAADTIARVLNGKIKRELSSLYGLVLVAAKSLRNVSGLDDDTVEAMLVGAIRHALGTGKLPPVSPASKELEEWERLQLKQWMKIGVPKC